MSAIKWWSLSIHPSGSIRKSEERSRLLETPMNCSPSGLKRKCVADYVLGQVFHPLFVIGADTYLVMNVEPGNMPPAHKHLDKGIVYQSLFLQHLEYMSTKEFTQRTQINLRHNEEIAAIKEKARPPAREGADATGHNLQTFE